MFWLGRRIWVGMVANFPSTTCCSYMYKKKFICPPPFCCWFECLLNFPTPFGTPSYVPDSLEWKFVERKQHNHVWRYVLVIISMKPFIWKWINELWIEWFILVTLFWSARILTPVLCACLIIRCSVVEIRSLHGKYRTKAIWREKKIKTKFENHVLNRKSSVIHNIKNCEISEVISDLFWFPSKWNLTATKRLLQLTV